MFNESSWIVTTTPEAVEVKNPEGEVTRMPITDITHLFIETKDNGPIGSDVIWYVGSETASISYPLGATGEQEALQFFQTFTGFDHGAVIKAMSSTDNAVFLLWRKA